MSKREAERIKRIKIIIDSLQEALKEEKDINFKSLCLEIMYQYGISRRTALEYIEVAKSRLE